MLPRLFFFIASLMALDMFSMDITDDDPLILNIDDNKITVSDLEKLFFQHQKYKSPPSCDCFACCWDNNSIYCDSPCKRTTWPICVISIPIQLLISSVITGLYCQSSYNHCIMRCSSSKCREACPLIYDDHTSDLGCIFGVINFILVPLPTVLATGVSSYLIPWLQKRQQEKNKIVLQEIHDKVAKGRMGEQIIDDHDLYLWGKDIMKIADLQLLAKVDLNQILILAQVDFSLLLTIIDNIDNKDIDIFKEEVVQVVYRLKNLRDMNSKQLLAQLEQNNISQFFTSAKIWETVVIILQEENLNNQVIKQLGFIFISMINSDINNNHEDIDWQDIINKVRNFQSVNQIIAINQKYEDDEDSKIKLTHRDSREDIVLSQKRLIEISTLFKNAFSEAISVNNQEMDFSDISIDWFNVLIKVAQRQNIDLAHNLKNIVQASSYFGINDMLIACDNFIVNNKNYKQIMCQLINVDKKNNNDEHIIFKEAYLFSMRNGLSKSQEMIARLFVKKFSIINNKEVLVMKNYLAVIKDSLDEVRFRDQLKIPDNLVWAWNHFNDISFLKDIMIDFCVKNNRTVANAWIVTPKDLAEAISLLRHKNKL